MSQQQAVEQSTEGGEDYQKRINQYALEVISKSPRERIKLFQEYFPEESKQLREETRKEISRKLAEVKA